MGSAKPSAWSLTGLSPLSFRVSALEEWGRAETAKLFCSRTVHYYCSFLFTTTSVSQKSAKK